MDPEKYIESIQDALSRRFRAAGHGSIRRVQEALHLGAGYFKDQRRPDRRRVDLRVLFRALEELDVDPADFFADALGPADILAGFMAEGAVLRSRTKRLPRILELAESRLQEEAAADPDAAPFDWRALDALAFDNPRHAIRRAHVLVTSIPIQDLPRLLGVTAAAYRLSDRAELAQILLVEALEIAPTSDPDLQGDLLQRSAAVAAQRGDPERALTLLEKAILAFVKAGNLPGVGNSMVDQGNRLADLGRWRRAITAFEGALEYLREESEEVAESRFCCLLSLATCYLRLGELELAYSFGERADRRSEAMAPALRGELAWLLSTIALRQQHWQEAERHLRQVAAGNLSALPIDSARATVELVRVLLLAGRPEEAYETAKSLTLSVQALRRDPPASAALTELVRHALAGRGLTVPLVSQISERLDRLSSSAGREAVPASRARVVTPADASGR